MKFSDILKNEHFCNLAAIVRIPFHSKEWQDEHPHIAFWTLWKHIDDATSEALFKQSPHEFIDAFTDLLIALSEAGLSYTTQDMDWLASVLDQPDSRAIVMLLLAYASAPDEYMTPVEIAEKTGTAESGWRNKAADGDLPGAIKKGKQWLIPASVLRSRGIIKDEMPTNRS